MRICLDFYSRCLIAFFITFFSIGTFQHCAAEPKLRDLIDAQIKEGWARGKVSPSSPATEGEFLRRVYLDLCGTIPTYEETKAFFDDQNHDKREKLIDRLLKDPRYAQHQADIWDQILFGRNPASNEARNRDGFQQWLREQFQHNTPYDQIAEQILKAEGNTVEQGAPMYLVQYQRKPEDATEAITQTFLGVQLQCARCHDHPFEAWSQTDFYGIAAFLARLDVVTVGKKGNESKYVIAEQEFGDILFSGPASEQEPGTKGDPIKPKFLLGEKLVEPDAPEDFKKVKFPSNKVPPKPTFSRKDKLAEWVTSAENPYFSKAIANRIWAQFMGRGIVHPVINMSPDNPPSHPELFTALTDAMIEHQFDLKWFIRELCNSKTYQLGIKAETEEAFPMWFERAKVRPLSAEELVDAWQVSTRYFASQAKSNKKPKEGERFFGITGDYALRFFGKPSNGVGDFQGGLHEHLYLNNGQVRSLISSNEGGLHHALLNAEGTWEEKLDELFMSILTRKPTDEERAKFASFINEKDPARNLSDAIWALMTCSEFRFNH